MDLFQLLLISHLFRTSDQFFNLIFLIKKQLRLQTLFYLNNNNNYSIGIHQIICNIIYNSINF